MQNEKTEKLRAALFSAWSAKSSTLWKAKNPALGQCGVTALVVQDILGGDILKTPYREIWHFYNLIDGQVIDFTESQFESELEYQNVASDRAEAFVDTNQTQYDYLKTSVRGEYLANALEG